MPDKQIVKRNAPSSENDLWTGINAYNADDLVNSRGYLEKYIQNVKNDSRAWNYLCDIYDSNENYDQFKTCIQALRESSPEAIALSWYYESVYNVNFEKNYNKAYDSIVNAVNINSEYPLLLNQKADIEIKLGKDEEAAKTIKRILEIDDFDSEGLRAAGFLAEKNNDSNSAIGYYESSFQFNPKEEVSLKLSKLYNTRYYVSLSADDLAKALSYGVASLILGARDVEVLENINGLLVEVLRADQTASWGEKVERVRGILGFLELDSELITPLENISDAEIAKELKRSNTQSIVNSQKIEGFRTYMKMLASWLYTFIGDRDKCGHFSYSGSVLNLERVLKNVNNVNTEKAIASIKFNSAVECLCEIDNLTDDGLNTCIAYKFSKLCGGGKVFTDDGRCLTYDQMCKEAYGINSVADSSGDCGCKSGYEWNQNSTVCVKSCPIRAHSAGDSCVCDAGYVASGGLCFLPSEMCSDRAYYSNGNCYCSPLYPVSSGGKCMTHTENCVETYGSNVYGASDGAGGTTCYCNYGYIWENHRCVYKY